MRDFDFEKRNPKVRNIHEPNAFTISGCSLCPNTRDIAYPRGPFSVAMIAK
jgi:hypothetical protein